MGDSVDLPIYSDGQKHPCLSCRKFEGDSGSPAYGYCCTGEIEWTERGFVHQKKFARIVKITECVAFEPAAVPGPVPAVEPAAEVVRESPLKPEKCADCRFAVDYQAGYMECRRRSPVPVDGRLFPIVGPACWCGEFERR